MLAHPLFVSGRERGVIPYSFFFSFSFTVSSESGSSSLAYRFFQPVFSWKKILKNFVSRFVNGRARRVALVASKFAKTTRKTRRVSREYSFAGFFLLKRLSKFHFALRQQRSSRRNSRENSAEVSRPWNTVSPIFSWKTFFKISFCASSTPTSAGGGDGCVFRAYRVKIRENGVRSRSRKTRWEYSLKFFGSGKIRPQRCSV